MAGASAPRVAGPTVGRAAAAIIKSQAVDIGSRHNGRSSGSIAVSIAALQAWAECIRSWRAQVFDVFVLFDNDQKSAAPIRTDRLVS
jgi:uncharacterized protein YecE (DUF72 family)